MKNFTFKIASLTVVCWLLIAVAQAQQPYKGGSGKFKKLVWADEFDIDGLPDTARWSYQTGLVRNNEEQYYTVARRENVRIAQGFLIIEGRKEEWTNEFHNPESTDWRFMPGKTAYTSACIVTQGKASWQYGRIEVRAKLPRGLGVWPAIWTLGDNEPVIGWPRCGEIDMMEFVGHDSLRVHGNAHYEDKATRKHASKMGTLSHVQPAKDFHVYAIEWSQSAIDFYFDDQKYHSFVIDDAGTGEDNPFRKPHFLLLNLALGGEWGGQIDPSVFPQQYIIDYVRVYQ
ncbi:family 16 glycosylhydrolase [Parapedobacter sp. 2B3]|uniref:glycoside hydrolase family 16 protein n=1 Tax=Parapedobacter sp. 2B3 TaxID=3342381 RepID=UPI0035B5E4FD